MKKLISVVAPVYNEENCIPELLIRLRQVAEKLKKKYDFEFIIVENGSTDNSLAMLLNENNIDKRTKIVQTSRNFGCDGGITAGLRYVSSDAAIIMNADLQDPPELILEFVKEWEKGYDVVYGVIKKRKGVSTVRKITSKIFYSTIFFLTKGQIPRNVSDFRLLDKKVYETVNMMPEHNRFLRGMIAWAGFKQKGIPFIRSKRFKTGGMTAEMNILKLFVAIFSFTVNAIVTFSNFPLKIISLFGILTSLGSFFLGSYFLIGFLISGRASPGYIRGHTSTILIILFLFGILFLSLGVIGEYIARIYEEVKNRPNYIIKSTIGFNRHSSKTLNK